MLGGQAAKGSFWDLVEILRESEDYKLHLEELPAIEFACRFPEDAIAHMLESGLLEQDDTHVWSESLMRRMDVLEEIKGKRRVAGSIGGLARAANAKQVQASAKQVHGKRQASSSDLSRVDPIRVEKKEEGRGVGGFDEFWKVYPNRKAKKDAIKAWGQTAKERPPMDDLLRAIRSQCKTDMWQRGMGIPYPASWLRGERWKDEGGVKIAPATGRPIPKYMPSVEDAPETAEQEVLRLKAAAECKAKIKELVGGMSLPEEEE